jgi:preprotein translocase subunit SecA
VEIVDEFTGRVMADRSWERGLHQLIELKEGCLMSVQHETLARISYQRFFRRYLRLSGMTGTAREVGGELWSVYGLPVVHIPTNRPLRRSGRPDRLFPTTAAKWRAVVERVRQLHQEDLPVLVGTRSVAASEHLSSLLVEDGLDHQVLNAKFDSEEADIISRAGEAGRITIATNMAGRGTDIALGPGVADRDGLHVILTERHEARRIDRQLAGRCGRQGDPGTHEAFLSVEDPLLQGRRGGLPAWLAQRLSLPSDSLLWRWLARRSIARAQRKLQRLHWRVRRDLLKYDEQREEMLSFTGRVE